MPARQQQLERILDDLNRQISQAEADLLKPLSDVELRVLIEKQADLIVLRDQVEAKRKHHIEVNETIEAMTGRESEVFRLIGAGLTSAEIAQELKVATSTVETYRERIKDKLKLGSGLELIRRATLWVERRGDAPTSP